jgi:uncharacterized protein (TIGR02246 family)
MHTTPYSFRHTLAVVLVLVRASTGFAQGTAADSQAIRSLVQIHAVAWNHRDAKAAAAVMAPDAVWITSNGTTLQGRAAIERAHREWLAEDSAAGGSTHAHPPESINIRFLRSDVAVADLASQFIARPKAGAPATAPHTTYLFIVLTKDRGIWHIAQLRNTLTRNP